MIRKLTRHLASLALVASVMTALSAAPTASAAPGLKSPKIKSVSSVQTFQPAANYYLVETTLSWKDVKGADVYLVCNSLNGGPTACATGIHTATYTDSLNGVPPGSTITYFVVACDTTTGPTEVCSQSDPASVTVAA